MKLRVRGVTMKYVFLQGSPRLNGNTATALKTVLQGIRDVLPAVEIQYIETAKLNIQGCEACNTCKSNGGFCVHSDDTNQIIAAIAEADFLIVGTPVYYWGMTASLKLVIDKFYSKNTFFRESVEKRFGLITVGGADTEDPQYDLIDNQFNSICEYLHWRHVFTKTISAYDLGEVTHQEEVMEELRNLGRHLGNHHLH